MPTYTIVPPSRLRDIGTRLAVLPKYQASPGVTHCNEFLRDFGVEAFDYHGFAGQMANQIADFLKSGSQDWKKLFLTGQPDNLGTAFHEAQSLANQGYFVVAALKLTTEHGHVAVVVNGQLAHSDRWAGAHLAGDVPQIAQAGLRTFCGERLSEGFSPEKYAAGEFGVYVRKA